MRWLQGHTSHCAAPPRRRSRRYRTDIDCDIVYETAEKQEPRSPASLFVEALHALSEPERDRLVEYVFESATGARSSMRPGGTGQSPHTAVAGHRRELLLDVARLLAKGQTLADVAEELGAPEDFIRDLLTHLPEIAEPKSKQEAEAFDLFSQGLRRRQVAGRLKMKERELSKMVLAAVGRESLRYKLSERVGIGPIQLDPSLFLTGPGARSPRSDYQMVPVRLAEPQHRRLKKWCEEHNFSMAVVLRGLVERFLEEQDRRALVTGTGTRPSASE